MKICQGLDHVVLLKIFQWRTVMVVVMLGEDYRLGLRGFCIILTGIGYLCNNWFDLFGILEVDVL